MVWPRLLPPSDRTVKPRSRGSLAAQVRGSSHVLLALAEKKNSAGRPARLSLTPSSLVAYLRLRPAQAEGAIASECERRRKSARCTFEGLASRAAMPSVVLNGRR